MSDDFAEMDDSTLISRRQEMRAQLERLLPHSVDHGDLQAIYDQSTEVINERARAAWMGGLAMQDKHTARDLTSRAETKTPDVSTDNPGSDWPAVTAAVRQRMTALKITTVELARNTGLSEATLRSIRAGTASPRPGTLARLSKGLGWPGGYLKDVAAGNAYLPTHGLMTPDVIARIDARLARVETKLDKLVARTAGFTR
jgi:transcriptional regulator with XRE-family HTH domain